MQEHLEEVAATCGTVPEVAAVQSAIINKREHPCSTCATPTKRFFVSAYSGKQQVRNYYCPNHSPSISKAAIWQNSRFKVGSRVNWQNKEYILQQFNSDTAATIQLLDPATGDTVDACPITEGKIVGLALVESASTDNKLLIKALTQQKITKCPLTPVQIAKDMETKVFLPIRQTASIVVAAQQKAHGRIKEILVANAELIRWAREEFGAQGRRVPVPGAPSYGEWLKANLTVELPDGETMIACSDRYVREVMADLDKQLAGLMKEQLELPPAQKSSRSTVKKEYANPSGVPEQEQEIYIKQLAKMTDCLLGNGDYRVATVQDRFKKAQSMAASVREAMEDGNTERFTPQPSKQTVAGLLDFMLKQHETAMDATFMLDTDAAIKNALQQFAQGLADTYCPKSKKAVVTVEFVDEKGAE